ncbi:type II secretion system protein [Anaerovorax odorimutans]|uniref:type II secretion system protein n=1 Tax=Anaerovorax odorimutans TaxID=109327 RepID=UPI0003FC161A|nr:hypothetical protein [Anaerovorax odorimutans]
MIKKFILPSIKISKKGFTLTELIISLIFVVLIFGAATLAWYSGTETFIKTSKTSAAYNQARSLESMLQNAASTTESLKIRENPASHNSGYIGNKLYSSFYLDNTNSDSPIFKVFIYNNVLKNGSPLKMEFDAIDEFAIQVIPLGIRSQLNYKIKSSDEKGNFYIEGGIILNNITIDKYMEDNPNGYTSPLTLNFLIPNE